MFQIQIAFLLAGLMVQSPQDRVDAVLNETEAFSGIVLVSQNGDVIANREIGRADDAGDLPMDILLDWRWASVTKQIVAVLVMALVEDGLLSLDTPLSEAAPGFAVRGADRITVRDLLRHTTGLPDPDDIPAQSFNSSTFDPVSYCSEGQARGNARFNYNNCDYIALEAVIENAGDARWEQQIQGRIFGPAGMTGTRIGSSDDIGDVTGYQEAGNAASRPDLDLFGAAGAIVGPPADLVRFNTSLMDGQLLNSESLTILWDGDPSLGYVALGAWSFTANLSDCDSGLALVERRGFIAGVQVRNILAVESRQSLVIFVNRADFDFGEIWMGSGFSYDLANAAFCDGES